jgi:transcriptional regulator with XRE-family HTH domain
MCEQLYMTIQQYRESLGLTFEAFAAAIGLRSKGHASDIEKNNRCSARLALEIERHSSGRVDAATLNADVAAARRIAA